MAEQEEPIRRRVALKIIKLGMDTRSVIARFEAERQALTMMDHPNIARILDAGSTSTGRPYFVMELVPGARITQYCDENHLSTLERIELFIQICNAVQHAHQKGIIHRDIKPSNILVTTLQDGVPLPKVIDFGIAKATQGDLADRTLLTRIEQFIGTPAYMSPEQAQMSSMDIDTRSDIYSLGVLLYQLLTGRTPFDDDMVKTGFDEVRRRIRQDEPLSPSTRLRGLKGEQATITAWRRGTDSSRLIRAVRGDLDWIVMKCLEKDRTRRYETAAALAMDLRRHLNNEPVSAGPPRALYRLKKIVRRNKLAVLSTAVVALALITGLCLTAWQAIRARRAEHIAISTQHQADELRQQAERLAEQRRRELYRSQMNLGGQTLESFGGIVQFTDLLTPWRSAPDLRGWEWYYLESACRRDLLTLYGHTDEVLCVAWSPDSRAIASGGADDTIRIWDALTGRLIRVIAAGHGGVLSVSWSWDGARLASVGNDPVVRIWNAQTGEHILELVAQSKSNNSVAWSPGGPLLASGGGDNNVVIWDADSGKPRLTFRQHTRPVRDARWNARGDQIASIDSAGILRVWDPLSGQEQSHAQATEGVARCMTWSPDGTLVAVGGDIGQITVWSVDTGKQAFLLQGHRGTVASLSWRPDGTRIISAGRYDWTIKMWVVQTRQEASTTRGHESPITAIAWSPDGRHMATASADKTVKVWEPGFLQSTVTLPSGDVGRVTSVKWSPDGSRIVTASLDKTIKVWNPENYKQVYSIEQGTIPANVVDWSPDGTDLASGSKDGLVKIWDTASGTEVATLPGHTGQVESVAWSSDGLRLASSDTNGKVCIWDTIKKTLLLPIQQSGGWVSAVAWRPDGSQLATASANGEVCLFDALSGRKIRTMQSSREWVRSIAWSHDGKRLASANEGGVIDIWNPDTGKQILSLRGHTSAVFAVAWNPDDSRIASGGRDGTVRIWDPGSGAELLTLPTSWDSVLAVDWSPEGLALAVSGMSGAFLVFDATTGYALERSTKALPVLNRRMATLGNHPKWLQWRADILIGEYERDLARTDIQRYWGGQHLARSLFETGWWFVGPYPSDMDASYAPEATFKPAEPVAGPPGNAAEPASQFHWQPIPITGPGHVDLTAIPWNKQSGLSTYLMERIYSPRTDVILRVSGEREFRLWLNNTPLVPSLAADQDRSDQQFAATLKLGWNTLLSRVLHDGSSGPMTVRLTALPPSTTQPATGPATTISR